MSPAMLQLCLVCPFEPACRRPQAGVPLDGVGREARPAMCQTDTDHCLLLKWRDARAAGRVLSP